MRLPAIVVPAEVALGGDWLHGAGIHSQGLGASPRLMGSGSLHGNCLRYLHSWILGSSPRMTMSPGPADDTRPFASDGGPLGEAPRDRRPRRSCTGRTLAPQSGDPFTRTGCVAPTGSVRRASRGLLAASTPLDPRVKPKDDDVSWPDWGNEAPRSGRMSPCVRLPEIVIPVEVALWSKTTHRATSTGMTIDGLVQKEVRSPRSVPLALCQRGRSRHDGGDPRR